jgi:hypothetical protein
MTNAAGSASAATGRAFDTMAIGLLLRALSRDERKAVMKTFSEKMPSRDRRVKTIPSYSFVVFFNRFDAC